MKIKYFFKCVLVVVSLSAFNSCKGGKSDKDGNKSIEGHNDPANTGGALGGDKGYDQASGVNDSTGTIDKK